MSTRREAILQAAQALFLAEGYAATTIAEIRDASGASIGSIYHAFGSKEGIAVALVRRAVGRWEAATMAARKSDEEGDRLETLVRATVAGLLEWGMADPDGFRVMDELRSLGESGKGGAELAAFLDAGRLESRDVLLAGMEAGTIRRLPWRVAQSLILGPAYEYLRISQRHPGNDADERGDALIARFCDAAWASIAPPGEA